MKEQLIEKIVFALMALTICSMVIYSVLQRSGVLQEEEQTFNTSAE